MRAESGIVHDTAVRVQLPKATGEGKSRELDLLSRLHS